MQREDDEGSSRRVSSRDGEVDGKERGGSWFMELLRTWGPPILLVILVRTFIVEPFRIPSGSMVPSLLIGDHVVVTKFSYGVWLPFTNVKLFEVGEPERGDIIVFRYPRDPSTHYIKRVIGIPGDRVAVQDNQVILNGVLQERVEFDQYDFIDTGCHATPTQRYVETIGDRSWYVLTRGFGHRLSRTPEVTVPPGHVWVLGDNRDNSEDSRAWNFVRYDQIKGKARRVWFSWNGCADGIGTVRTERLMRSLYEL